MMGKTGQQPVTNQGNWMTFYRGLGPHINSPCVDVEETSIHALLMKSPHIGLSRQLIHR